MKKLEITVPEGKKAEWVNGVLTLVDEKDMRPITERANTHENACKVLNIPFDDFAHEEKDVRAYKILRIIAKAWNEDAEFPRFVEGEKRWYPYVDLYTKEEVNRISEADKKRVLFWGGPANNGALCGLVYATANPGFSVADAPLGARLGFKSEELVVKCVEQFPDLWRDYLIGK
jgi:hypothetical protein